MTPQREADELAVDKFEAKTKAAPTMQECAAYLMALRRLGRLEELLDAAKGAAVTKLLLDAVARRNGHVTSKMRPTKGSVN